MVSYMDCDAEHIVEMNGITKRFSNIIANDNIDFCLHKGEIHALLGENGAGKTTLMNILYGLYKPDSGNIYIDGNRVNMRSPRDAIRLGIGMLHQHFKLIPSQTVLENIAISLNTNKFLINFKKLKDEILKLSEKYGFNIDPDAKVWQLSAGEMQRVEIIRILMRGARILILDEPTSVLTPQERNNLFRILRKLADEGNSIIFITHKLDEVFKVGDRVTVLRRGKKIATVKTSEVSRKELVRMMVGDSVEQKFMITHKLRSIANALEVKDLHVIGDRGNLAVAGVTFTLRKGEILGIAGIAGNGQRELAEAIVGLRRIERGKVLAYGKDITNRSVREIISSGIRYIPDDRLGIGVCPNLSVYDNLILRDYYKPPFSNGIYINMRHIKELSKKLVEEFNIITPGIHAPTKFLSGGNIQKLILARELFNNPKIIIASEPTRGLDILATNYIRRTLISQRNNGVAILLISSDLDEIIQLSDRIAVMYRGKIVGIMDINDVSIESLGLLMMGEKV